MEVVIPTDQQVFESQIATYWFEDEVLISLSKSIKRTVPLIKENVELIQLKTANRPVPLLIYLTNSTVPDKATRQYSTEHLPKVYSAMAMVSQPGLAQLIMNLLFRFKKPPIPMKSFTNKEEAMKWLKEVVK